MKNIKISQKLGLVSGILTLISVAVAALVFANLKQISNTSNWNDHTHKVLTQIDIAGAAMVDQETGVRGYLISRNDNFLAPYRSGGKHLGAAVAELSTLTADNAEQQTRIAALKTEAARWERDVASREIGLAASPGGLEAARALESSGAGKTSMDAIRKTLGDMRSAEAGLLVERSAKRDHAVVLSQIVLVAGGLASAVISIALGLAMTRLIARPVSGMTEVMSRLAAGDLAVAARTKSRRLRTTCRVVPSSKPRALKKRPQRSTRSPRP